MTREEYFNALTERHGKEAQEKFSNAAVGIAGLGGLGSNIAFFLARLGIGKLVLADFDRVDVTNLNRQQYRVADLGRYKAEALKEQLLGINPYCVYEIHSVKLTEENIPEIFSECDIICEAFDKADQKAMITETVLSDMKSVILVSGSGMAGTDSANKITTRKVMSRFYLCGDEKSDIADGCGLMAPRVAVCAAHQATAVMKLILGQSPV